MPAIGGCMRSWVRFFPKTPMASSWALAVSSFLRSFSIDGAMRRLYASRAASSIYFPVAGRFAVPSLSFR